MKRMVKIGKTGRDLGTRLSDLHITEVPQPFECEHAAKVKDLNEVESDFHLTFGPYRNNPKREFFSIEPEQAITLIKSMASRCHTCKFKKKLKATI